MELRRFKQQRSEAAQRLSECQTQRGIDSFKILSLQDCKFESLLRRFCLAVLADLTDLQTKFCKFNHSTKRLDCHADARNDDYGHSEGNINLMPEESLGSYKDPCLHR